MVIGKIVVMIQVKQFLHTRSKKLRVLLLIIADVTCVEHTLLSFELLPDKLMSSVYCYQHQGGPYK